MTQGMSETCAETKRIINKSFVVYGVITYSIINHCGEAVVNQHCFSDAHLQSTFAFFKLCVLCRNNKEVYSCLLLSFQLVT